MEYPKNIHKTTAVNEDFNKTDAPLRILVVDDDDKIKTLLVQCLKEKGYDVQAVDDGVSALKQAEKYQFDVVITDWDMQDVSGAEIARLIRQRDKRVIIFAISGWNIQTLSRDTNLSFIDRAIKKPFRLETITEALEWAKMELDKRERKS